MFFQYDALILFCNFQPLSDVVLKFLIVRNLSYVGESNCLYIGIFLKQLCHLVKKLVCAYHNEFCNAAKLLMQMVPQLLLSLVEVQACR